jgi:hypothetical protein
MLPTRKYLHHIHGHGSWVFAEIQAVMCDIAAGLANSQSIHETHHTQLIEVHLKHTMTGEEELS